MGRAGRRTQFINLFLPSYSQPTLVKNPMALSDRPFSMYYSPLLWLLPLVCVPWQGRRGKKPSSVWKSYILMMCDCGRKLTPFPIPSLPNYDLQLVVTCVHVCVTPSDWTYTAIRKPGDLPGSLLTVICGGKMIWREIVSSFIVYCSMAAFKWYSQWQGGMMKEEGRKVTSCVEFPNTVTYYSVEVGRAFIIT